MPHVRRRTHPLTTTLAAVGAATLAFHGVRLLAGFFGSPQPYGMQRDPDLALDSEGFITFLSLLTNGAIRDARLTRLRDGAEFFPAMLDAIRKAQHSVNIEFYEFLEGRIANEYIAALTDRARAGVEVRVLVDAVGSFATRDRAFAALRSAGGRMCWYNPLQPRTLESINNRTHRKLVTIDGVLGFLGGAGVADQWIDSTAGEPAWRDTMFRVEGEAVAGLISTFSENWLEASGEILCGPAQFRACPSPGGAKSFVVLSTPHGGGTQAHILFQALIQSARKSITITTPYFLPDRSARAALVDAIRQRGVKVRILTAGPRIDHPIIRRLSRHSSRHLLQAGAEIFEYQPAMIHAKLMTMDEQWCVLGSTNFDHRSFALNDEINLAVLDPALARVIEGDFADDLRQSAPLTLAILGHRGPLHRIQGVLAEVAEQES